MAHRNMAWITVLFILAGCSPAGQSELPDSKPPLITQGRQLFADYCAACHGENARGGVGPDLSATAYKYGKDRQHVIESIMDGRSGGMPAFASQLQPSQAAALADYLRSLK